jgi:hypothetical protein
MLCNSEIQCALMRLAKHYALDNSMESDVQQDACRDEFDASELGTAAWRLDEANRAPIPGNPLIATTGDDPPPDPL